jgi:hypothetical protein
MDCKKEHLMTVTIDDAVGTSAVVKKKGSTATPEGGDAEL